jgi:hypothetical protein
MAGGSLLTEREAGTLRRLLTAPLPKGTVLAGKTLAYMLLACMQVVVIFLVAGLVFDTPMGKSPLGLVLLTLVTAFNAVALGMLVAALSKTAKQVDSIEGNPGICPSGCRWSAAFTHPFYRSGLYQFYLQPHSHEPCRGGFYQLMAENLPPSFRFCHKVAPVGYEDPILPGGAVELELMPRSKSKARISKTSFHVK